MKHRKTALYFCTECGYETQKWLGKCPGCSGWNTMEEKEEIITRSLSLNQGNREIKASRLEDITEKEASRISTGLKEFDRVLGSGAVESSSLLIGGDPGVGKSTLLLQASSCMATRHPVIYISGEESLGQIKMRARRMGIEQDLLVASSIEYRAVFELVEKHRPRVLIVDSIQAVQHEEVDALPGSVSQVKEVANGLINLARQKGMVLFLVGHVTKEGSIAGPRLLEHMVDGVFYLEGDRYHTFRLLRGIKNRFGSTNELGVFIMEERGLVEVENPSYLFLSPNEKETSGSAITVSMEGSRPLLVEIQSLVNYSSYSTPRRTTTGIDTNRAALIMAVLEKHAGFSFYGLDAFISVVGGVRLFETAVDLAVALSLVSSVRQKPVRKNQAVFGEISLTGEIRPVSRATTRVKEAEKLGMECCILPQKNKEEILKSTSPSIEVIGVNMIEEALEII